MCFVHFRSLLLNIPGLIVITTLATLTGLVVYSYYATVKCDPLDAGYISSSNQVDMYRIINVISI